MQDPEAFFEAQRDALKQAAEAGGGQAVVSFIETFHDPVERRVLYLMARRVLVMDDWDGKSLDAAVRVARAGIDALMQIAKTLAADDPARGSLLDLANAMSYNLAADAADCWPGDTLPRERRHFEAGLRASQDAVRLREQLGKPPAGHAIAWWARGYHELALGRARQACDSLQRALDLAREAAVASGHGAEPDADGTFLVLLHAGYLALAEIAAGRREGRERRARVAAGFGVQAAGDDERAEEARFGLQQLAQAARARGLPDLD